MGIDTQDQDGRLLPLALASARQAAFEWDIPAARLRFLAPVPAGLPELLTERILADGALRASLEAGTAAHTELQLDADAPDWQFVAVHADISARDAGGRPLLALGVVRDLSAEHHAELAHRRLAAMYEALSQTHQAVLRISEPVELYQEVCRIAVDFGKFHLATIRLVNWQTKVLERVASFGEHVPLFDGAEVSIDPELPTGQGPSGRAIRSNAYSISNDLQAKNFHAPWKAIVKELGLRSAASFPFEIGGRAAGVLILYASVKNFFDDDACRLLSEITQKITYALAQFERSAQRRQIEQELADSEARYRSLIDLSPDAIMVHQRGKFIVANAACVQLFGAANAEQLLGTDVLPYMHEDFRELGIQRARALPVGGLRSVFNDETWLRCDGTPFYAEVAATKFNFMGARAVQLVIRDVTARRHAEQLQKMQNDILGMIAIGAALPEILAALANFLASHQADTRCVVHTLTARTGLLRLAAAPGLGEVATTAFDQLAIDGGSAFAACAHGAAPLACADVMADPHWRALCEAALLEGRHASASWPILGRHNKVLGTISLLYAQRQDGEAGSGSGHAARLAETCANLAGIALENKEAEERIRHLAHYDELTGLPNRTLFNQILTHAMKTTTRGHSKLAVLFVDLDRFKIINDTLGHDAGDLALQEISQRMRTVLREADTVARMGGDEFYILIEELTDGEHAANIARKILTEAERPVTIKNQECQLTASIGIAVYPDDGHDALTLLKNADIAMYRSKASGKNTYHFYSAAKNMHSLGRLALEAQLRRALEVNEFVLHYQPKVNLATGLITGVEALVRWLHPDQGLLAPNYFIPLAEETGLIVPLGKQILERACRDALAVQRESGHAVSVAVNLSARQFDDPGFLDDVRRVLDLTGLPPALLQLELTESMVMANPEQSVRILQELQDMGILLDIDDFGTGYSSLAYLKRFPVHSLKIDRSFIQDLQVDANDAAITRAIIAMGHSMGLRIIAEGVELPEQMASLRELGCDEFQGYLFSRPVPLVDLLELCREHGKPGQLVLQ